jgi:hypothetical protein
MWNPRSSVQRPKLWFYAHPSIAFFLAHFVPSTPFLLSLYRVCVLGHAAECSVYYGKQDHWESQEELSEVKDGIVL